MTEVESLVHGAARSPVPAVTRAVSVLEAISGRRGPASVSEIARTTGMAKSSVSNLVQALAATGMVRAAGRGWVLGHRVLELGQSALASSDLISEFRRLTLRLPTLRSETVLIGVLDDLDVLYLGRHNGDQPIRLATDIGHRLPAVVTSLGKAMLASLAADELTLRLAAVARMPRLTPRSFATVEELREDLALVRRRGYAVDDQQNTAGVTCFGVAVRGYRQPTAVSTTLLSDRVTPDLRKRLISELTALARQLSSTH